MVFKIRRLGSLVHVKGKGKGRITDAVTFIGGKVAYKISVGNKSFIVPANEIRKMKD